MKKVIALFLLCILCVSFAACQPTPDKPIVQSKNDGELEDKLAQDALPEYNYSAPETWKTNFSNKDGSIVINVDANVDIQNTQRYPVARISKIEITNEWAQDKILRMSEDGKMYTKDSEVTYTKSEIEEEIQSLMNAISDPNSDLNSASASEEERQASIESKQREIEAWQRLYKDAPDEFVIEEIPKVELKEDIQGLTEGDPEAELYTFHCGIKRKGRDDKHAAITVTKTAVGGYLEMTHFGSGTSTISKYSDDTEHLNNITISKDEAIEYGKQFIESLGESGFEASFVTAGYMDVPGEDGKILPLEECPQCYDICYTRSVNGVKMTYRNDTSDGFIMTESMADKYEMAEQYAPFWPQEYIELYIRDNEVFNMTWVMPAQVEDIINENVEILPFEEVQ